MPGRGIPPRASTVRETLRRRPPALVHPGWTAAFPWLVQGTTTRGEGPEPFDLGLFTEGSPDDGVRARWSELAEATGAATAVHARQVHGAEVRVWPAGRERGAAGPSEEGVAEHGPPRLVEPCDGHATDRPGVLLAVTTADCVPVFLVDSARRAVAVLHAGWRGAAAGVVAEGLDTMAAAFGSRPSDVHVHLGPAICGSCYEVGPEVFEALEQAVPAAPTPVDLRAVLAERAVQSGVRPARLTVSAHCTCCTDSGLFSHRGGDAHRQVGYLGIRA